MKKIFFTVIAFCVPASRFKNSLLNMLGAKIAHSADIGHSIFYATELNLEDGCKIGHLNFFYKLNKLTMAAGSKILSMNQFSGDFSMILREGSRISNFCIFRGAKKGLFLEDSYFEMKPCAIVTSSHYFDLSSSISVAERTVIGGRNSQFWTHGFVHVNEGRTRYIKLDRIEVGEGVYIGSNCTVNPGTIIENNVNVVSATTVNGRLAEGGVYGSSSIRKIMQVDEDFINNTYELDEEHSSGNPRIIKRKNTR